MKSNIWILLLALWFSGCDGFLEESSQDEIRPSTVDDMEQLLLGEVYLAVGDNNNFFRCTDIFTDDIKCNGLTDDQPATRSTLETGRYTFGWQRDMFDKTGGGNNIFLWEKPYQKIKGCNVVIDYLDRVTGNDSKRLSLKGEAYVMRAYYYFMLVNFFGLPYNYGDPEKNLGVPLKLDMGVRDEYLARNTVAEVYRSIEKDLLLGNRLLEENPLSRNFGRAGDVMAKVLLSRMYLYMENWDKALEYADAAIKEKPALLNLSSLGGGENVYRQSSPDEIIWARQTYAKTGDFRYRPPFSLSDDFASLFNTPYTDFRESCYCAWTYDADWNYYMEFVSKDYYDGNSGIRTAEGYLNKAEACIRKYIESGDNEFREQGLEALNHLRSYRYDTSDPEYKPLDGTDGETLLNYCKGERRRELCGEDNHRWFDLRRYGMPELKHVFFINPGEEEEFVLEKNSTRYALPIPETVREANLKLEPNL